MECRFTGFNDSVLFHIPMTDAVGAVYRLTRCDFIGPFSHARTISMWIDIGRRGSGKRKPGWGKNAENVLGPPLKTLTAFLLGCSES